MPTKIINILILTIKFKKIIISKLIELITIKMIVKKLMIMNIKENL